jgi:plasmid stabilization system protein ParE
MDWNEKFYDRDHAERYLKYLLDEIGVLCRDSKKGQRILALPELHFVLIRRGSSGYGHIIVYRRKVDAIEVLHVFHSSQNWQQKLINDFSPE